MKPKLNFKKPFLTLLTGVLFLTVTSEIVAQEKNATDLKDFKIIVEKTDNGIKMKGIEGSAWIDLSFSINNYRPQTIDEYGMTKLEKIYKNKDENLADFLFTIIKTESGIELKGIEGTAWTVIKFSLAENKKQAKNQLGTTSLN